jgi:hypothetical protein
MVTDKGLAMNTVILHTTGDGYWSDFQREVAITDVDLAYISDDSDFGELRVVFDTEDWNVDEHGLIYTDSGFFAELKQYLEQQGLDTSDLSYSEQGMQGDDYVSLDVGELFIASWRERAAVGELLVD